MAHCLMLLAQSCGDRSNSPRRPVETGTDARATHVVSKRGPYKCKTCSKCFTSFQAMGGHRGSHKKPKAGEDKEKASMAVVMQQQGGGKAGGKPKVLHECSLCGSGFTSRQALDGHMGRHRIVQRDITGP
ncbi:Zinc finger protein [Nymphaea thermarum]|nr:Zinc finger protein [Nymphaea thermarum]